ncbi:uridylate kinase [Thermanaerovibrio acidaminovorans DSM 6589]|uniref:Uridylate kinase n=1 Tax=Thermanaerovibrio acidaminovorans (strain ATCC 49978 / DSM 6589 / Su883) TaxID=525903 RepID=D1B9M4_THEAS|nr:UMP kinase [Thermanaerovibrio acidaminovorans]ACZ18977.1 uridylate kinase [Thermanaerovibrio acidaminovorans DSM 6589]
MGRYERVLLKLSGEILAGSGGFGLDLEAVTNICSEIAEVAREGIQVAMVVGGGNIMRGQQAVQKGMERSQADNMGMLATVINALALQDSLERMGISTRVQTAIEMRQVAEPFIRRRAIRHLEKGRIVIFAAGTGSPYFSTDTAAALRASEIGASCLMKATKVDGIYDDDPHKNPNAKRLPFVSYHDALTMGLKVMDAAAFALCQENQIPIVVFDVLKKGNLRALLVDGSPVGSLVSSEPMDD